MSVRAGASYAEHRRNLSHSLQSRGLEGIDVQEIGPYLATEDLLEMVNSGFLKLTVADQYLAEAWARVMPDLVVKTGLAIHEGGEVAFAVRPGNPQLLKTVNAFVAENRKGTARGHCLEHHVFEVLRKGHVAAEPIAARHFGEV